MGRDVIEAEKDNCKDNIYQLKDDLKIQKTI